MKVYCRSPYPEKALDVLKSMFDEVVYDPWTATGERFYEDEMLEHLLIEKPDVLITELDRVTAKVLAGYKGLKVIGDCRAAPANIEVDECTKAGIPLLCTPGRNNQAVAEMEVAGIIMLYRNILPAMDFLKQGKWVPGTTPYFMFMGHELQGRKVGFVGFGAVGQAAAKIMDGFDCDICFYGHQSGDVGHYKKVELEELFSTCDIVSLHLPVTDETRGMINEKLLRSMKKDAILVNYARSAVIDTPALIRMLDEKAIAGAVIDVFDNEPPTLEDIAVLNKPNVILTPHVAGATYEVTNHQAEIINERLRQWLKGENLERIVFNKAVLTK
ncbi:MAG: 3-phosphoglycerate dehydrogenase [Oscillospiraceae bacterium]|nr:3-phosphoglycerate dehydrogenase [Oscillospiraceae bacterium]